MKRKLTNNLIEWHNDKEHKPLIIYGARQVGKTYLIKEFGKKYYNNVYEINFEFESDAISIFEGNLSVDQLLIQLTAYKSNAPINGKKTLIFFDEIQKCPQVLTALKAFALDGRFDVIASGSMLGIILHEVSSYPVGYVSSLYMKPLSFEEFLWANNYSEEQIAIFKSYYDEEKEVPTVIHNKLNELFLQYVIVGGMPEVVNEFIKTKDISKVIKKQKEILNAYDKDIAKYATSGVREKVRECYNSIPDQLAKENKKYKYKLLRDGGNARHYSTSLNWISDAGLGSKVYRLKCFDIPLKAYRDEASFKFYFNDTGLLLSMYEENVQYDILKGNLGVFKGGIFENVIAQILSCNEMPTYYYRRDDRLEIDFVTIINNKIVPIEVKSSTNTKSKSFNNVLEKENIEYGIKLSLNNVNCSNPKIKCFPLYLAMFIGG